MISLKRKQSVGRIVAAIWAGSQKIQLNQAIGA
jgi:hypothetical protein